MLTGYRPTVSTTVLSIPTATTQIAIFGRYDGYPYCESIAFTSPHLAGSRNVFIAYWIPTPPPPTWPFPEARPMWEPQWTPKSPSLGRNYTNFTPRTFSPYLNPWVRVAIFNNAPTTDDFFISVTMFQNAINAQRKF